MIPQVYMSWTPKLAKCRYCGKEITTGTPEIVVIFHNDKHTTKQYYHPVCWIQHGLDNLNTKPFVQLPTKAPLTPEQKIIRYDILKKYAALRQRQRKLSKTGLHYQVLHVNIESQIAQLMLDILPIGGVPKKWASHE